MSAATGWDLVPLTILRDGPFGPGMCQVWVEHGGLDDLIDVVPEGEVPAGLARPSSTRTTRPATRSRSCTRTTPALRRTAVLDAMINNADRKAGHLLPTEHGLRVVDHGVCFNVDPKLRTVLWGWAGEPLTDDELARRAAIRAALDGELGARLGELLDPDEVRATVQRVDRLLRTGELPLPQEGWPALPWPPF